MSHIAAPQGNSVTQMNTNATRQIAGAVNSDSPGATSIATNMSSTEQTNLQGGPSGARSHYGTTQANDNTTVQFAIAANYDSPNATAIAVNRSFTEQANGLTTGTPHDGNATQVNDNSTKQIDIALNIDSPGAVAIADNSNVTGQANGTTTGNTSQSNNVAQVNSSKTTEVGIALDINSPGAIAQAGNSNTTIQGNSLATVLSGAGLSLADLALPSLANDTPYAGSSLNADQREPSYGGFAIPHSTSHSSDLVPVHPS